MTRNLRTAILMMWVLAGTTVAQAESTRREGSGETSQRMQNMVRQLTQERDALRSENSGMQEQIKKLIADVASAKKQATGMRAGAAEADAQAKSLLEKYKQTDAALRERIDAQNVKSQQLVDKYKELVSSLREVEMQNTASQDMVISQAHELDRCAENNVELYQTSMEILQRYDDKGVWDSLVEAEPITQIKRVKIENMIQDYRGRLGDAKINTPNKAIVSSSTSTQ